MRRFLPFRNNTIPHLDRVAEYTNLAALPYRHTQSHSPHKPTNTSSTNPTAAQPYTTLNGPNT